MAFGRFHGTSPTSGKQYDEECGELVGGAPWEGEDEDVTATVSGHGVGPGAVALGARRPATRCGATVTRRRSSGCAR